MKPPSSWPPLPGRYFPLALGRYQLCVLSYCSTISLLPRRHRRSTTSLLFGPTRSFVSDQPNLLFFHIFSPLLPIRTGSAQRLSSLRTHPRYVCVALVT